MHNFTIDIIIRHLLIFLSILIFIATGVSSYFNAVKKAIVKVAGGEIIKRAKSPINFWFTFFLQLSFSMFSLIIIEIVYLKLSKPHWILIVYGVFLIFCISILHRVYRSLKITKKTILKKVYWIRKDAKEFKRVILFKLVFALVGMILVIIGIVNL